MVCMQREEAYSTVLGVNSILNMKVFLLAAAGSGNLANEHSLDLLIS